jgi:transcriptional regulator with XRE-family HTH domain
MRVSSQSHTLAVLRILVGLTQKEMAAVLHCSAPTIQAIELGKLNLSEKLAGFASLQTGVNLAWLLEDDVTKPPINTKGKPYTKKTFEEFQAIAGFRKDPLHASEVATFFRAKLTQRLSALLLRAYINEETDLCTYKLSKAFDELEKQFQVTAEDHKAMIPPKRTPRFDAEVLNDTRLVAWEWDSRFKIALRKEERKKGVDYSSATPYQPGEIPEGKAGEIDLIVLDDKGQTVVRRFPKKKPSKSPAKPKTMTKEFKSLVARFKRAEEFRTTQSPPSAASASDNSCG